MSSSEIGNDDDVGEGTNSANGNDTNIAAQDSDAASDSGSEFDQTEREALAEAIWDELDSDDDDDAESKFLDPSAAETQIIHQIATLRVEIEHLTLETDDWEENLKENKERLSSVEKSTIQTIMLVNAKEVHQKMFELREAENDLEVEREKSVDAYMARSEAKRIKILKKIDEMFPETRRGSSAYGSQKNDWRRALKHCCILLLLLLFFTILDHLSSV